MVIVGDQRGITIPDLQRYRTGIPRLRGLRLVHTHLQGEPLTEEDLTDLTVLRLDMIVAIPAQGKGHEEKFYSAYLLPENPEKKVLKIESFPSFRRLENDFLKFIQSLEDEFQKNQKVVSSLDSKDRGLLISVSKENRDNIEASLEELKELAESSGVKVLDVIIQRPQTLYHSTLIGEGKLKEVLIRCMQLGADLLIFDQNLTPSQVASISDLTDLRVIDRTQLILDIFAQRAQTQEGKIQVELAQLRYLLPRLAKKPLALSRLTGGIGGRGPGETKLEIDRRRVKDRIHLLERELEQLSLRRQQRRARRKKAGVPILSIIGYTNAGKSTLFNLLTRSHFKVEDKLFATLDPAARRFRWANASLRETTSIILTDTVGFIKDLPKDLMGAFRPTFEELKESDLLIHLVDISHPRFQNHMETIEKVLRELDLDRIPRLLVFNKEDRISPKEAKAICQKYGGVSISALRQETLGNFFLALEKKLKEILFLKKPLLEEEGFERLTNRDSFDIQIEI
ncbi:MAG: GTPase HflX [Thermodesulfobacteriota bacterium]